jgi:hypothetical protein
MSHANHEAHDVACEPCEVHEEADDEPSPGLRRALTAMDEYSKNPAPEHEVVVGDNYVVVKPRR